MDNVDTATIKQQLRAGGFGPPYQIDQFCKLLADRMGDQTNPPSFLLDWEILASDLESAPGREIEIDGKMVWTSLAGLPLKGVFHMAQRRVIKQVFSVSDAADIIAERDEVFAIALHPHQPTDST